jgi:hypothetical protein
MSLPQNIDPPALIPEPDDATESERPGTAAAAGGGTKPPRGGFRDQLRTNWLAIFSLAIALFGLGYNTFRNETTERQRNVREAGFIVLDALGELQQLADTRFFGNVRSESNRIAIWGRVTLVKDIAGLVSNEAQSDADTLFQVWSSHASDFDAGKIEAEKALTDATREVRAQVLNDLHALK